MQKKALISEKKSQLCSPIRIKEVIRTSDVEKLFSTTSI